MNKKNKSKKNNSLIYTFFIIVILSASVIARFYKYDKKTKEKNDVIFETNSMPRIDGSIQVHNIIKLLSTNYSLNVNESLLTDTYDSYIKLISNKTDLIIVPKPNNKIINIAKNNNVELELTKFIDDGIVFVVNKNNPINNLSIEQINNIYSGNITNWNLVGGSKSNILLHQYLYYSPLQEELKEQLLINYKIPNNYEKRISLANALDLFSNSNSLNSIVFTSYYYAKMIHKNENIKFLSINNINPNSKNITDNSYPFITTYYIVTRKGDNNKNISKLKKLLLSNDSKLVAQKNGYADIK